MKHLSGVTLVFVMLAALVLGSMPLAAQQALDPANYITSDNAPNLTTGTTANTPEYKEVGPWYTGTSTYGYGVDFRQTSQLGGESIAGRSATWIVNIPAGKEGVYILYVYVLQAANNASSVYYTIQREFELNVLDSVRHDERRSALSLANVGLGAWVPITIDTLTVGNTFVTVGADTMSGTAIMRADAVRLVRSVRTGADLEFGRRTRDGFATQRAGENWLDSPLGSVTYMEIPLYNYGGSDLIINNAYAVVKPNRWSIMPQGGGGFPMVIHPGSKKNLAVGFRPYEEESVADSLVIESNDSLEVRATIPLTGNGINYNFIMNASLSNEPFYNAPFDKLGDPRRPTITLTGAWSESGTGFAAFPFPIAGGNLHGIYSFDTPPATSSLWKFQLPDSVNGKPGSSGYYFIEDGRIAWTDNAEQNVQVQIVPAFSTDTVRGSYSQRNMPVPPFWTILGGGPQYLTQGDFNTVLLSRPESPTGQPVLRSDLLRIRKIPTGPAIIATGQVNFGNVSVYNDVRLQQDNYHLDFEVNSGGESLLRIDRMEFSDSLHYSIANPPTVPYELPAVNGKLRMTMRFLPDGIASFPATLSIYTNDTTNNPFVISITGSGVGTVNTVEESDPQGAYVYPASPVVYPDLANLNKWQIVNDAGASGGTRMVGSIYHLAGDPVDSNQSYVEYFPEFPLQEGQAVQVDTFNVYAQIPAGSANSSPTAKYIIYPGLGADPITVVLDQNGRSGSRALLGRAGFLRSGSRDAHGGGAIVGYVRLENDTTLVSAYYKDSLVNSARRDTFVLRADAIIFSQAVTGVETVVNPALPVTYSLSQNFPNPFNPTTEIRFALPKAGMVSLVIYDLLGRQVRTLVHQQYAAGAQRAFWDGRNDAGTSVSTGVYLYRISVNNFVATKKMLFLK